MDKNLQFTKLLNGLLGNKNNIEFNVVTVPNEMEELDTTVYIDYNIEGMHTASPDFFELMYLLEDKVTAVLNYIGTPFYIRDMIYQPRKSDLYDRVEKIITDNLSSVTSRQEDIGIVIKSVECYHVPDSPDDGIFYSFTLDSEDRDELTKNGTVTEWWNIFDYRVKEVLGDIDYGTFVIERKEIKVS